jgi:hypothetical protein
MVKIAKEKFKRLARTNCFVGISDSRAMPVASKVADIAIEGWSLVQIKVWHETRWQAEVGKPIEDDETSGPSR